ncbi:MAG TPA: MarR family transcriptional regulator [Rhodocyclaceae bacterium]|nr:MarR family transcriptional regulator [Rhodocyclaceae bacterium]
MVKPSAAELKPSPGELADDYLAVLIIGLAYRLNRGAANYYKRHWGLGVAEWRVILSLGKKSNLIVREVAEVADLDNAAASRSLGLLKRRGLVEIMPTTSRGNAALAKLTPEGRELHKQLKAVARRRQKRLIATLAPAEVAQLTGLLRRLIDQVPEMNAED